MSIEDLPDDAILNTALKMTADGIIVFNTQGVIGFVNEPVEKHLHCPAPTWQEANALDLVASEASEKFRMLLLDTDPGSTQSDRFPLVDRNGNVFDAEVAVRRLDHGYYMVLIRDILGQIRWKRGIPDFDSQLLQFVEYNPASMAMFDRDMRYIAVSSRWLEDYRLTDREIIGHSHYEIFPELPERWKEIHRRSLNGEILQESEDSFERADGTTQWLRWTVHPWRDQNCSIGGIVILTEDISDRIRARNALKENENNFRTIINESPLPISVTRISDGKVLYVNARAMRLFMLVAEDLPNLIASDLYFNPDERYEIAERIKHIGHIEDFEVQLRRTDGVPIWTSVAVKAITYKGIKCWLTIFQDITERKFFNELIGEAEHMAKFGTYRLDINKGTWQSCEVLDEIFGIGEEYTRDVEGWLRLVHPEHRDEMRSYLEQQLFAELLSFDREYRIIRANDGEERWVHGQGSLKLDSHGKPFLLFGSIQDITEHKLATARIDMFRQAIDQAGEAILITDSQGKIEYINPAFTRITGYSWDEAIGQNPRILNSGNQDSTFYHKMWNTILSGQTWQGRVIDKRKDGSFYPCLLSISSMYDATGERSHFVGIQQDLREYEELEHQFYQAQKMEALGILVGGIAHDFNNTLAGITGNIYLAQREAGASPSLQDRLKSIEMLSFRAADMIKHLLAFSRKGQIEMRPLSLSSLLKEAVKLHRASLPVTISLNCDIREENIIVRFDPNLLQQVLMNLINNARDAVKDVQQPRIDFTLERFRPDVAFLKKHSRKEGCEFALLRVSDNGIGIPSEHLQKIFEPFFTTKEENKGTGLGLAMVYGAMHSHDSIITVDSREGQGAQFNLYLPLIDDESGIETSDDSDEAEFGHGEMILLADDDSEVLTMTQEILQKLGYHVITAHDGKMAVDIYREHRNQIALVILDMVMPKLDGPGAYHIIREIDPDVKVMFLSGYDGGALEKIMDISMGQIINKPFKIGDFGRRIKDQFIKTT